MNKWKLAFWICLILLLLVSAFSLYSVIDQGVTITYMRDSYEDTETDLNTLSKILNETTITKPQIKSLLERSNSYNEYSPDTVSLERVELIFDNDTLRKIRFQW
jgi:hypothetical protein